MVSIGLIPMQLHILQEMSVQFKVWAFNQYLIQLQFQQMIEKSIDQKLKECKTVIIQNVQKSMHSNMIYRYLKEEKIDGDVKKHILNTAGGYIIFEFNDHEKAKLFYDKANFKDRILIRPFNIYFNVQLSDNEMKKYYFQGINQENVRRMFDLARNIGVCKIYTNYTSPFSSGKLKPSGVLSFVRKEDITQQQFNKLKEQLQAIGIKLFPYSPQKGLKCAVLLTDFYKGDLNQSEEIIEKKAKQQATALIKGVLKDFSAVSNIASIVKRRQIANAESKQGTKTVTKVKAIVQFQDSETAINSFEQIRKGFIKIQKGRAILHFYSAETNSYISLFTSGLEKKGQYKQLSDKQFQDKLLEQGFKKVNPNVIQVNIFPSKNNTYIARVYLKNETQGRNFIVDYDQHRHTLIKFYKSENNIRFNINIDDKTMKKIKQYEKRTSHIMAGIKNEADRAKIMMNHGKGAHHLPLNQPPFMMQHPSQLTGIMTMPPQSKHPMMGNLPQMSQMGQPNYPMVMGGQMPPFGIPQMGSGGPMPPNMGPMNMGKLPVNEMRQKIDKLYLKRAQLVQSCKNDQEFEQTFRKQTSNQIKFVLQNDLKVPSVQAHHQTNKILQSNDIGTIIDFLKRPNEFYTKVLK